MRRRQSSSRRRWTSERRMRAELRNQHHSEVDHSQSRSMACWAGSLATDTHPLHHLLMREMPLSRRLRFTILPRPRRARPEALSLLSFRCWMPLIPRGESTLVRISQIKVSQMISSKTTKSSLSISCEKSRIKRITRHRRQHLLQMEETQRPAGHHHRHHLHHPQHSHHSHQRNGELLLHHRHLDAQAKATGRRRKRARRHRRPLLVPSSMLLRLCQTQESLPMSSSPSESQYRLHP